MARTLLAHDLIDEMRLMIDPIVVGRGKRLFPDDATEPSRLRLSDSQVTLLAGAWRCRPAVTVRDASEKMWAPSAHVPGHLVMKLAATASAVLAAGLSLSACDLAATIMQPAASPAAAPPPTCHQQYEAWKHGVVGGEFAVFRSALKAVNRAARHQDAPKLAAALKQAGAAARWLSATPPPHCADPKRYYGQMLAKATAAADSAKASTRPSALILAADQLKMVPGIEKRLKAELDNTVGVKR